MMVPIGDKRGLLKIAFIMFFSGVSQFASADTFPKIVNLWGVRDWSKDFTTHQYDAWAKYDMLVTAGGSFEQRKTFYEAINARSPETIILYTATLTNLPGTSVPWMKDEWYLKRANGEIFKYWAGTHALPNLLIDECFEAVVEQAEKSFKDLYQAGFIDGIYVDSVIGRVSFWANDIDTNLDGVPDIPIEVDPLWHQRQNLFFDRLRQRNPGLFIVANSVDSNHAPHVHGRSLEGVNMFDFVADGVRSPHDAVYALERWMNITLDPALTFALMCYTPMAEHKWREGQSERSLSFGETDAVRRNYKDMRLGLVTTLMTDGYYSYDFGSFVYGAPAFWYAEYDAPLGQALSNYKEIPVGQTIRPRSIMKWRAGESHDIFILHQSTKATSDGMKADFVQSGSTNYAWQTLLSTRPDKVRLKPGATYRIKAEVETPGKDMPFLKFIVRTEKGGTISTPPTWQDGKLHDKGIQLFVMQAGLAHEGDGNRKWHIDTLVTLDDFSDYSLQWSRRFAESGTFILKSLDIEQVNETYFMREFEGGLVVLNGTNDEITVTLDKPMYKLKDDAAPRHEVTVDNWQPNFSFTGQWESKAGRAQQVRCFGADVMVSSDASSWAECSFVCPDTDSYTFYVSSPGGDELTDAATYTIRPVSHAPEVKLDQRKGDGGWMKLFEAALEKNKRYTLVLRAGQNGITVADAVKIESARRFNDGSIVGSITLDKKDGIILLNEKQD